MLHEILSACLGSFLIWVDHAWQNTLPQETTLQSLLGAPIEENAGYWSMLRWLGHQGVAWGGGDGGTLSR